MIQTRLGHSSIRVTLDTYGHLFEGLDDLAAVRLDDLRNELLADSTRTESEGVVAALRQT